MAIRTVEMDFQYMNTITKPPIERQKLRGNSTSNDNVTVDYWLETWLDRIKTCHELYGPWNERAIDRLYGIHQYKPCIVAGSGPSLKKSIEGLKRRDGIPLVSCLHNFNLFEDEDVCPEYYVTLDSGEITIKEVYEGGKNHPDWYWERTKERTLLAYIGTHPDLIKKWQGEVLFYKVPAPHPSIKELEDSLEIFSADVSTGGNVLGACVYIAKLMGCNPITFVGADFSFSYTNKFHSWDSPYDEDLGQYLRYIDVYGNSVKTWQSYYNFKCFFDWLSMTVPGLYINCTEGGILGAYTEGNISSIMQMDLDYFLEMYQLNSKVKHVFDDISKENNLILW